MCSVHTVNCSHPYVTWVYYNSPYTKVIVGQYTHCGPPYIELTNTIPTIMRFFLTCLWVWLFLLRLSPTHYPDPSMTTITGESPETVRFAHHVLFDSYGVVVVDWKRMNSLKLKTRGVYRVHPRMLYRVHRPATVIVTLLLASGDIESNPGPVQYPCTVCEKLVKRNQRGILCDGCSQWTHARCGGVEEAEYLLLTAQESCEWFCPSCVPSKLPAASLSLLDINNSSMLLQSKIEEVSSTLSNTELSGVSNTSLHHSGAHSEDCAKKRSAKNRKYYETHKARILANRKQKYKENAEVEKAASRLRYDANPEPQKTAARHGLKQNIVLTLNHKRWLHVYHLRPDMPKTQN